MKFFVAIAIALVLSASNLEAQTIAPTATDTSTYILRPLSQANIKDATLGLLDGLSKVAVWSRGPYGQSQRQTQGSRETRSWWSKNWQWVVIPVAAGVTACAVWCRNTVTQEVNIILK